MANFKDRTGETKMMNCGLKATIIRYRKAIDIDIQFEDGLIVEHLKYYNFAKGNIRHKHQPCANPTPYEEIVSAIKKRINTLNEATSSSLFWKERISLAIQELTWLKDHIEESYATH